MKTRAKSYTFPKKSLILTHKPPFFAKAIFIANRKGLLRYWKTLMTLNDRDRKWPLFQISKNDSKGDFCNQMQNRKHLYLYISTTYSIFSIFYGEKLAFCFGFLYLCTGNRKNSLLVPKVGHLWRPRLVLIDGRRWSSMKTTKWAGNGFLGNCDSRNS